MAKFSAGRCSACLLALVACSVTFTPQAYGLIVMNLDPSQNYVAPTTTSLTGYTDVDPGWANITQRGIYLGNGWVISANHTFNYPATSADKIHGDSYDIVANSISQLKNPKAVTDAGYSTLADIKLYRIDSQNQFDGSPEELATAAGREMQPIIFGHSTLGSNKNLVIMTQGTIRNSNDSLLYWTKDKTSTSSWSSQAICNGCFASSDPNQYAATGELLAVGYSAGSTDAPAWGTNKVESASSVSNNLEDGAYEMITGGYYVFENGTADVVAQPFDFDEYSFTLDASLTPISGGGNEAHVAGGDSGGGVFSWNSTAGAWELNGVLHSSASYITNGASSAIRQDNGSSADTKFGDLALFSNFAAYADQIEAYLAAPDGYEDTAAGITDAFFSLVDREFGYDENGDLITVNEGLWGDINLDGVVSGDGTGTWEDDDVTAFREGWGWDLADEPGAEIQGIFAWKHGDLNQDGTTDWSDFLLLRQGMADATGTSISLAAVLSSSTTVPEPTSAVLVTLLAAAGWAAVRRQR